MERYVVCDTIGNVVGYVTIQGIGNIVDNVVSNVVGNVDSRRCSCLAYVALDGL